MSFLYPFLTFLQPGMLWPGLIDFRPALVAAALGLVFGLASRSTYPRSAAFTGKPFIYLAAFIFIQGISLYYSGVFAMIEELSFWLPYLIFVFVSITLMADERSLAKYIWGMIAGGMVIVLYGIYAVPAWGGYEGTGRAGAYGMYDNHNDYSFIVIQIVPFVYLFWRTESSSFKRILLAGSLLACALGIAMSLSRGGMIALVVEAVLIVLMAMKGSRRFWLLPLIAVLGAGAIAVQYAKRAENQGDRYTAEDAESSRFELWRAGKNIFLDKPILGVGSRRFFEFSGQYYELSHDQKGKNSHNTFIEIATGTGILGLLTFFLSGKNLVRELRRRTTVELPPKLEAARLATLISMYAVTLRALLDAKTYDWSFYTLGAIGIGCYMLIRAEEERQRASQNDSEVAPNGQHSVGSQTANRPESHRGFAQ